MASGATQGQAFDQDKSPVCIVGAGPAGLACAIVVAWAGHPVMVHEQRADAGGRFRGDFQGPENWSSEEDVLEELAHGGIAASFDTHAVSHGIAFDAWGGTYQIRSAKPLYYLVRRGWQHGTLDQGLLEQAQALGVESPLWRPREPRRWTSCPCRRPARGRCHCRRLRVRDGHG